MFFGTDLTPEEEYEVLRNAIKEDHAWHSYRKMSEMDKYCGMPAGTLSSIVKSRIPVPVKYRELLGMSLLAPARVCPIHGVVHVRKTCPSIKRNPKKNQLSINRRSAKSAANSIVDNTNPDFVGELITKLLSKTNKGE